MVGCLYISDFPAWARQTGRPDRHAVAVYQNGRIIARSRFLAQSGMRLDDPLERARALYPAAAFFDRDLPFEQAVWEGILQRIGGVTPHLESLEHGVAFFRPSDLSEARLLAEGLVAHVGLGPDKNIAKIAGVRAAPGSVLQIRAGAVTQFLAHTNVSVLSELGFEEEIPLRLELFGLTTLDVVHALTRRHLQAQFGSDGILLFDLLHPSPEAAHVSVYVPPTTISEVLALDAPVDDLFCLVRSLGLMVRRATLRLGRLCCSRIAVQVQSVNTEATPRVAHRLLKNPSSDPDLISRAADYLLQCILQEPVEVSSIRLTLAGLENPRRAQGSLFFERPPLRTAIERLEERFPGAIRRALLVPDVPFPEDSVRFVPFSE